MRLSLRTTLIALLAGLQLAAGAAILAPIYLTSEATLMGHARNLMRDVAFTTITHSDRFLAPAEAAAELSKRLAETDVVASDDPDLLEQLLFEQLQLAPQFAGIYFGDEAGNFVYVKREADDATAPYRSKHIARSGDNFETTLNWRGQDYDLISRAADPADRFDPRTRPWYLDARQANATIWTDPYIFYSSQAPGITVASPVFDASGTLRGVVGVDIKISAISNFLANLKIGESGRALILNHNGDVIAHPDPTIIKTRGTDGDGLRFVEIDEIADPIAQAAFASMMINGTVRIPTDQLAYDQKDGARYLSSSFEYGGANYVSTIAPMTNPNHPWTIGVYAPRRDFIGALQRDRDRGVMLIVLVAGLTAMAGILFGRRILKPVQALADRARQISRGQDVAPVQAATNFVEMRRANLAFNRMSIWLSREKRRNTTLQARLQAEADALEARVLERTADLAAVNAKLEAEVATRSAAEGRLQKEVELHSETSARLQSATVAAENANAAKSKFLSSMSHELRSPLNAIIGYTDLLLDDERLTPVDKRDEYLEHVRSSGRHLLTLVEDVLDLENIDSGQMTFTIAPTNPLAVIRSAISEQQVAADNARIRIIDLTAGRSLPPVNIDPNRLRQALVNLLSNALKYCSVGDEVTIGATLVDQALRIFVSDTGPGIPEKLHERLFTPFDRLGAETSMIEGAGVGLAISKQLMEQMGGQIGFASQFGAGSQFWVDCPLADRAAPAESASGDGSIGLSSLGIRDKQILYVDDNQLNLALLVDFLSACDGLSITAATTGAEGLKQLRRKPFDLYLIDVNLPDISGYDLLAEIRRLYGDAPVLAVSADAMPIHVENGLKAGFDEYVTKPVRLLELARDIEFRLKAVS